MSKERVIKASINLLVEAGKAAPSPPVGPALGQLGVNIMEFCKAFNDQSQKYKPGTILPVRFVAYTDRTFEYEIRNPTVAFLLKSAAGIMRGSQGTETVTRLDIRYAYEIMKIKKQEARFYRVSDEGLTKAVLSAGRNMGIEWYAETDESTSDAVAENR
eukprot:Rmarinus@m.8741